MAPLRGRQPGAGGALRGPTSSTVPDPGHNVQSGTDLGGMIAVAMSGGVDSSVAAALLVEAGHPVVGIMLRPWSEPGVTAANRCCTPDAVEDARKVADALGIPFSVLDIEAEFKADVVDRYVDRAAQGLTPNPCFDCNKRIRFGLLLRQALALGAGSLATGHYARIKRHEDGRYALLRGTDGNKDQSYVLHALGQSELRHAVFPLGGLTKPAVRALATGFDLPVAARPDSVDLCWVGEGGVSGFLGRHLPEGAATPGPIVDETGRRVGQHAGLPRYTLGQRRGLGVAVGYPVYVVAQDQESNTLVVGDETALMRSAARVESFHWSAGGPLSGPWPLRVQAQVRYRAKAVWSSMTIDDRGGVVLRFDSPQRAPTPGQGLVVYDSEEVIGGGLISSIEGV